MRYKKSEVSAAQIVQAAIRVLARQGYARTSLMDIAKEAGMSKGALHYHFASKEALIQVVLETACNAVADRTKITLVPSTDLGSAVRASIAELWKVRAERTDEALVVADLLAQALYDEALRPQLAAFYRFAANQVYEQLTMYLGAIGLRPKIPEEVLPRILIGLLDGLVLQVFVEPDVLHTEQVVQALEALALSLFEGPGLDVSAPPPLQGA